MATRAETIDEFTEKVKQLYECVSFLPS